MEKLLYNYHTHTYRCKHAVGTDEDYVLAAIEAGIKVLGFSDHAPFPNMSQGVRMDVIELQGYVDSINSLKEKYKNQIEIHVGLEIEYYPEFEWWYKELLEKRGIEYLILGEHCYYEDGDFHWFNHQTSHESMKKYTDLVIAGARSGFFKYICHPDMHVTGFGYDEWQANQYKRIIEVAVETNLPIEINLYGIRKGYHTDPNDWTKTEMRYDDDPKYPYLKFWELASQYPVKTIIAGDVHNPTHFFGNSLEVANEIVKMYNLDVIEKIDL